MVFEPGIIPNELLINLPNFFSVDSLIILSDKINFSKAPESRIDFINLSPSCSISAKIATASPPAAAIIIIALQEKNFKSDNNLSKNIMSVGNSPGTKIYPGEIAKGLKLLKKGKKIDYEGATNIEFDVNGDTFGTFLEKEISRGKFRTRQQR